MPMPASRRAGRPPHLSRDQGTERSNPFKPENRNDGPDAETRAPHTHDHAIQARPDVPAGEAPPTYFRQGRNQAGTAQTAVAAARHYTTVGEETVAAGACLRPPTLCELEPTCKLLRLRPRIKAFNSAQSRLRLVRILITLLPARPSRPKEMWTKESRAGNL